MIDEGLHIELIEILRTLKIKSRNPNNTRTINQIGSRALMLTLQFLSSLKPDEISDNSAFCSQLSKHAYDLLSVGILADDLKASKGLGSSLGEIADTLSYQGATAFTFSFESKLMTGINSILESSELV